MDCHFENAMVSSVGCDSYHAHDNSNNNYNNNNNNNNNKELELEKKTKYEDLRIEIARLWNKESSVIPIVFGALGTLAANLKKNLKELGIPNVIPCL